MKTIDERKTQKKNNNNKTKAKQTRAEKRNKGQKLWWKGES